MNATLHAASRRMYAQVRLVNGGVRTPTFDSLATLYEDIVPFIVILEPLYLGVLPASVLPTVLLLTLVVACSALFVVPFTSRHVSTLAKQARAEIASLNANDRKHD